MKTNQQDENQKQGYPHYHALNKVVTAAVFIIAGLTFLGRNLGLIDPYLFHIIISWQMLLIVIGISFFFKRNFWGGLTTTAIGCYFLLPEICGIDADMVKMFWPVLLIIAGLSILFNRKPNFNHCNWGRYRWGQGRYDFAKEMYNSENGFVASDNTFGSIQQIVLDPVFKGARLRNTFGGIVLDLRRTKLEVPETVIDVDCTFGGIEIYMPANWNLQSQVSAILGGCDDKRYHSGVEIDQEHILVVRGSVTFGGIEFKS